MHKVIELIKKRKWWVAGGFAVLVLLVIIIFATGGNSELEKMMKAEVVYAYYDSGPVAAAFLTKQGDYLQVAADGSKIGYTSPEGRWAVIHLNENRLPVRVVDSGGSVFVFENYKADSVDIAIVGPDGKVTTKRKVPLKRKLTREQMAIGGEELIEQVVSAADKGYAKGSIEFSNEMSLVSDLGDGRISGSDAVDLLLFTAGITTSVTAIIFGSPAIAAVGAVAAVIAIANAFIDDDALFISGAAMNTFGCATVATGQMSGLVSCASFTKSVWDATEESSGKVERGFVDEINLARATLIYGSGNVQATLVWNNGNDIDLWMIDPQREAIGFKNKRSRSGGQLDVDDTNGLGPENIFWLPGRAPFGKYVLQVHHYSGRGSSEYKVLLRVNGHEENFTGTLQPKERKTLKIFTVGGLNAFNERSK